MILDLDLQNAVAGDEPAVTVLPSREQLEHWATAALGDGVEEAQLTVRLVGWEEGSALNEQYRPNKKGATNVLSFPFEAPPGVQLPLLGDIVICAPVVEREAEEQAKDKEAHWAHMVVHGCLHLLGYDHIEPGEAVEMESLETRILADLGYSDPYAGEQ